MASHFEKLEQTLSEIQLIYDEELSERERELGNYPQIKTLTLREITHFPTLDSLRAVTNRAHLR